MKAPLWWRSAVFAFCWISLLHLIVYFLLKDLPGSVYHHHSAKDEDAREAILEKTRTTASQTLADLRAWKLANPDTLQGTSSLLFNRPFARLLCVGIVSYWSGEERLLTQTIASLLSRTHLSMQDRIRVTIFNAEDEESKHEEALNMADLIAVQRLHRPRSPQAGLSEEYRRSYDYAQALRALYDQRCEYGLLLEDGAVAGIDWATALEKHLIPKDNGRWTVVRLMSIFNRRAFNHINDLLTILTLACLLLLLIYLTSFLLFRYLSCLHLFLSVILDPSPWIVLLLLFNNIVLLLFFGPTNMPPVMNGLVRLDTHYLAVANLYPQERLLDYAHLIERHLQSLNFHRAPELLVPHDRLYRRFERILEKNTGHRHYTMVLVPNPFQNVASKSDVHGTGRIDLKDIPMSTTFADDHKPIVFDQTFFLESNPRDYNLL